MNLIVIILICHFGGINSGISLSPTFLRDQFNVFHHVLYSFDKPISFPSDNLQYTLSADEEYHICVFTNVTVKQNKDIEILNLKYPLLNLKHPFECLIINKPSNQVWKDDIIMIEEFKNLLAQKLSASPYTNIVKSLFSIDTIIRLSWKLRLDTVVANQILNKIIGFAKMYSIKEQIERNMNGNYLNVFITNAKFKKPLQISNFVSVNIENPGYTFLIGTFNLSIISLEKQICNIYNEVVLISHNNYMEDISYSVNFRLMHSNKHYECIKRNIDKNNWSERTCLTSKLVNATETVYKCQCYNDGLITLYENMEVSDVQERNELVVYKKYASLDLMDDKTKYLNEDMVQFMPVISYMKLVIQFLSLLAFISFIYTGGSFCVKRHRFFHVKEVNTLIFFLACLSLSHCGFHSVTYFEFSNLMNVTHPICLVTTLFHFNYVVTPVIMQVYVFLISVAENKNILQNIILPFLLVAPPITSCAMVMFKFRDIQSCSLDTLNLEPKLTLYFIMLPCAGVIGITIPMMVITLAITKNIRQIFGFPVAVIFGAMHGLAGFFLFLCGIGNQTELSYYLQFCLTSIVESLFMLLLVVFLLILNKTNTSLIDKHCTTDLDSKIVRSLFGKRSLCRRSQ